MKTTPEELYKIKEEYQENFKNKIYRIMSKNHYTGEAFVYAENVNDANEQIENFKKNDLKNRDDSWGYMNVDDGDFTGELTDEQKQVTGGIYYTG